MDIELNKVMGAVLGTLTFAMALNIGSTILYTPKKPAILGYDLPVPEPQAPAGGGDQQAQAEPLPVRLASADAARGQSAAKKCLACHVFEKGGANKIGPNLYAVVARPKGSHAGFAYSSAMKAKGGEWGYDDLDQFLASPKGYVPGTIMAFAGVSSPKERADILGYLRSLADSPVAFPEATVQPASAPGAPPAGGAPAGGAPAGASQSQQQPAPALPGQRVEPGPAPTNAPVSPAPAR